MSSSLPVSSNNVIRRSLTPRGRKTSWGLRLLVLLVALVPGSASAQLVVSSKCCCNTVESGDLCLADLNVGDSVPEGVLDLNCLDAGGIPGPSDTYESEGITCNGNDTDNCASACATLAVELVAFTATVNTNTAYLTWQTASETNNAGFEVEHHRADHWQALGFVTGHGTTLEAHTYHYSVSHLDPGLHRFRLKQVDADGSFTYSAEVEITAEVPGAFVLSPAYPNPFNPQTRFTLVVAEEQAVTVEVVDALGHRVALLHEGMLLGGEAHAFRFTARALPSGVYLIRTVGETFEATRRVVLLR